MSYRDILVHLDNSPRCAARVELAISLAREHKAHLTGLYVVAHRLYELQGEEKAAPARELFLSQTARSGIVAEFLVADWSVAADNMAEMLNFYAFRKDLVIVGQTDQDAPVEDVPVDLPERVVLGSGTPTLVVPYVGHFENVPERVVVAWVAGRASARAVHDAMPLLLKAKQVRVVTVTTPGEKLSAARGLDIDLGTHLGRHNIAVKEETLEAGDVPVDKVLMNYAWEHGCGLLVMGVYAHTVRGALQVSPVARLFFDQMTLPVLMSN